MELLIIIISCSTHCREEEEEAEEPVEDVQDSLLGLPPNNGYLTNKLTIKGRHKKTRVFYGQADRKG